MAKDRETLADKLKASVTAQRRVISASKTMREELEEIEEERRDQER